MGRVKMGKMGRAKMGRREPLRIDEREIISRELSQGRNARYIGRLLGRHHSTIYDEIDRNGGATSYRAVDAQRRAEDNRARPKDRKLETSARLHDAVNEGLHQKWSPEQISKRLKADHPDDPEMRVSHETIVRHEAPGNRVEVRDLHRRAVAAAW
jgi:IS30 family transposase